MGVQLLHMVRQNQTVMADCHRSEHQRQLLSQQLQQANVQLQSTHTVHGKLQREVAALRTAGPQVERHWFNLVKVV